MAEEARRALAALIDERREDYASLSHLLGRNPAYIQQYIRRGTPKRLAEADRRTLARYFQVPEERLGGPPVPPPPDLAAVPILDVRASAGPGREVGEERAAGQIGFPRAALREMASAGPEHLSMIRVDGASMEPLLSDGDSIIVDRADAADGLRDGVYVLRLEDRLLVKRLALTPTPGRVDVRSDNRDHPGWDNVALADLAVIGRVVWVGRRVR